MDWEVVAGLTKADADLQEQLADDTAGTVQSLYSGLDWYDHAAIAVTAGVAGEVARAAAQQAAALTAAYLTRVLREMVGNARGAGVMQVSGPLRSGVASWATAYGRVADTVRFELSRGATIDAAVKAGLIRADLAARTDLLLARRGQSRDTLSGSQRVTGYRRVVHPELSKGGSCGLCIAAANRRYSKERLMPIHRRCKCTVVPITAEHDPGGAFDLDPAFQRAYDLALSTSKADLADIRVRYEDHGELGPVMSDARHRSANPGRNKRRRQEREEAARQRPPARPSGTSAFDAMSRDQLQRQLRITEGLPDSTWRTDYLARLRARLAALT